MAVAGLKLIMAMLDARALHPAITRPFSRKRTVPTTEVDAVIVSDVPFCGEAEKVSVTVGVPTPTVMVMASVAVAPD